MLKESDIIFEEKPLKHGELEVIGSVEFSAAIKLSPRDTEKDKLKEMAREVIIRELNYKIWGRKNKDLRKWILIQQNEILRYQPASYEQYEKLRSFFCELLTKIS